MTPAEPERVRELEERFAHLERHVGQQDRAMLEMAQRIDLLETRLRALRERLEPGPEAGAPAHERPPHY